MKLIITAVGSMPQVSLINDFKKENCEIIGLDCNPLSVGFHFCDKHYVIPKADDKQFISSLITICKKERPNTIIISPDEELVAMQMYIPGFKTFYGIKFLIPSFEDTMICTDKWKTYQFFKENNIPTPDTELYNNDISICPAILKPRQGRGGSGIFKIKMQKDNTKRYLDNYIIQEFIEGKEYSIDILSDWDSKPISIIIRERIEVESGISVKSRIVFDEEIENYVKKIVKRLGLIGMSCIQCIRGKRGLKFTEINLRFGGGSVLSRRADPTIIPNYLRLIEGKELLKPEKPKELIMLRYYSEIIK